VLGVGENDFLQVVEKSNSVPAPRIGHDRLVEETNGMIAGKGLFLTGNYFHGVSIEDCVSRSRAEFSRLRAFRHSL